MTCGHLVLITAPTDDIITVAEAKAMAPPLATASDDAIQALLDAAVQLLDPAGGGALGRALRPQTWELRLDGFPVDVEERVLGPISLPYPPLISVVSVKYDDPDGVEQTLVEGPDFRVLNLGGQGRQIVAPLYLQFWPIARWDRDSARIQFTCGYSTTSSDSMPAAIKQAVALLAKLGWADMERNLYVSGETVIGVADQRFVVTENATNVMRAAVEHLLSIYRVW